jgi:3',5'-cyclic AMP phosphodiesterase CpdA
LRIAHFSDLHLLDLTGVATRRFLNKRISGWINIRLKRGSKHRSAYVRAIAGEIRQRGIDHVCITGDLTNLALEPEYELARRVLREDLGLDPKDVTVVPGNHDLYTRGAQRSGRFREYFAEYLVSDLPELSVDLGIGRFPVVKLRDGAAIIGLSSAVPRPPLVASGELGRAQLDALAKILAHPEVARRTPVIALHHPAHNPPSRIKTLLRGLHDADVLLEQLASLPHALVLHGHLHERMQTIHGTHGGRVHALGATSASLFHDDDARMAGFNVYELGDGGDVTSVEAHVYEPDNDRFRSDSVPKHV